MLFFIIFVLISLYIIGFKRKYYLYYFFLIYPILPDYFAIELGGGLPLLKASRVMILIMIGSLLVHQKGKIYFEIKSLKKIKMLIPLCIYFIGRIIANGFYCFSLTEAINTEFSIILEQLILTLVILQLIKSQEQLIQCINAIVYGSGIVALISIISVGYGQNLFYNLNIVSRNMLMASTIRMGIMRAEAGFGHPVYYGLYCALMIPLAYYLFECRKKKRFLVICVLNVIGLLLTESRGSIAALIVIIFIAVIRMNKVHRQKLIGGLVVIIMAVVVISLLIPSVTSQITDIFKSMFAIVNTNIVIDDFGGNSSTGLDSRLIQFTGVVWTIMNNALFGLGASCHTRGALKYYKNTVGWFETTTIDNGIVGYFVQEGIFGTIGFLVLSISLILIASKLSNKKDKQNINNVFVICFISYLVEMFSVADASQMFWIIIILFLKYNIIRMKENKINDKYKKISIKK